MCDAAEVVGPAGGTSSVRNEAPSGSRLRAAASTGPVYM